MYSKFSLAQIKYVCSAELVEGYWLLSEFWVQKQKSYTNISYIHIQANQVNEI